MLVFVVLGAKYVLAVNDSMHARLTEILQLHTVLYGICHSYCNNLPYFLHLLIFGTIGKKERV